MKTNNKQNTGLIFELLSQQITESGRNNDEINVKKALYLIRKYFHKGTQLYEELSIFNTVLYNEVNRWSTASRLLTEVLKASKELDQRKLKNEKYHLLQEVYANFDRNVFFKRFVPQYKLYSTIFALMEDTRGNHKIEISEKVRLEESICKHLTDNKEVKRINEFAQKVKSAGEPEIDDLTFFFIIKKFNEKYEKVLSPAQKQILNEYIRCTSERTFDQFVGKQTKRIENELYESMKTVKDKSILQKLYESLLKLGNLGKLNKSQKAEALMTYQQLVDELKKLKA
jgi:hypothetical protein